MQNALTGSQVSMISSSKPSLETLSLSSTFINYTVIPANNFGFDLYMFLKAYLGQDKSVLYQSPTISLIKQQYSRFLVERKKF